MRLVKKGTKVYVEAVSPHRLKIKFVAKDGKEEVYLAYRQKAEVKDRVEDEK